GEIHEDWNSKESEFGLKEWNSMEETLESKSEVARTGNRLEFEGKWVFFSFRVTPYDRVVVIPFFHCQSFRYFLPAICFRD
ncbi:hypothetical protein L195_g060275, partial [Trifolium pratense]